MFLYADKVSCGTNIKGDSKENEEIELPFSFAPMKFCNSMLRATPAVPT